MPTMSFVRSRSVPSAKNSADRNPMLAPKIFRKVESGKVSPLTVYYLVPYKMPIALRCRIRPRPRLLDGGRDEFGADVTFAERLLIW